ncbi:hypothetical protein M569_01774, partial [Genlisea aurea]
NRKFESMRERKRDTSILNEMEQLVDKKELTELTKMVKTSNFICTFCFKKFNSAQSLGGHQNKHREERLQEK